MQTALDALDPLDSAERQRAMNWLAETLAVTVPSGAGQEGQNHGNGSSDDDVADAEPEGQSPKEFMDRKAPSTEVERIACLAYYLTKFRKTTKFKTADLTDLNTEAAGHAFSNASQAGKNAMSQNGFLTQAGKGTRQITAHGERVVEALPERDKVSAVIANAPKRRKRAKRGKKE